MHNMQSDVTNVCDSIQPHEHICEAMKLVGDFWTLRIVDALSEAELRFCGIERAIPDINPATLTARLKRLEEADIIERSKEAQDKQSVSYYLTDKGRGLLPVLASIKSFTTIYNV